MKEIISSFELHFMIREFQDLVGARLDKIYHRKDELVLQLYSAKTKKAYLTFKLPSTVFLGDFKPDTDDSAGGFCMFLRKKINLFRIESISQIGFERIVKIRFVKNDEIYDLVVELVSPGNILLLDKDNKILSMQNSLITANRVVRGGLDYIPLSREYNPFDMSEKDLVEFFAKNEKDSIVKAMAMDLGFGGIFAEEICILAKVNKDIDKPRGKEVKEIFDAIVSLKDRTISPVKIKEDIFPFALTNMVGSETLDIPFCNAVAENLKNSFVGKKHGENLSKHEKELKKAKDIIKKQKSKIKELEKLIDENQKIGELIYEKYSDIEELLKTINDAKKKHEYKEIKEKLIEKGFISDLNEKEQSITLDL